MAERRGAGRLYVVRTTETLSGWRCQLGSHQQRRRPSFSALSLAWVLSLAFTVSALGDV